VHAENRCVFEAGLVCVWRGYTVIFDRETRVAVSLLLADSSVDTSVRLG
jgi:hypothetical protein